MNSKLYIANKYALSVDFAIRVLTRQERLSSAPRRLNTLVEMKHTDLQICEEVVRLAIAEVLKDRSICYSI